MVQTTVLVEMRCCWLTETCINVRFPKFESPGRSDFVIGETTTAKHPASEKNALGTSIWISAAPLAISEQVVR
jgi:hypothetical protein